MNMSLRLALVTALAAFASLDTLSAAVPHSGQVIHDGFELSDVALFVLAAAGVWLARRSMRARAKARPKD